MELKSVALTLLWVFVLIMVFMLLAFVKAMFKFPTLRHKVWHGITNGDMIPTQDDFQRTAQLFFAIFFGVGLIIGFLLWMAFPVPEWHIIIPTLSGIFIACVGLRYTTKHQNNGKEENKNTEA